MSGECGGRMMKRNKHNHKKKHMTYLKYQEDFKEIKILKSLDQSNPDKIRKIIYPQIQ